MKKYKTIKDKNLCFIFQFIGVADTENFVAKLLSGPFPQVSKT